MKRTVFFLALLTSVFAFGASGAQATVIVSFAPGDTYANVGSTFNVNINALIHANEALTGWGFDLLYDPAQLSLNSVSASPYWDLIPLSLNQNNLTALLLPDPNSPDPGLSGTDLLLATLNFTCLGPGKSLLDISVNSQDLAQGFMTFDGQYAAWQALPGSIEQGTEPVPEPSTILSLSIGLVSIALFSRKSRKHSSGGWN